jgi:DNA repair photolyase
MTKLKIAKIKKIYAPQNAEFCQLAFNGWRGCAHRCRYCYGPRQTHKTAEEFRTPQPKVGNIFQDLDSDLQLLAGNEPLLAKEGKTWIEVPRPVPHVLLMSDCDPYSPPGGDLTLPRKVLAKFNYYGIPFKVLTKAGTKAAMDFDLYDRERDFFWRISNFS